MGDEKVLTKEQLFDRLAVLESTAVLDAHTTAHNEIAAHDAALRTALAASQAEVARCREDIRVLCEKRDAAVDSLAAAEKENERLTEERISASAACADEMIRCEGLILDRDAALKERDEARQMFCEVESRMNHTQGCDETPREVCRRVWPADADRLFPKEVTT